MNRHIKTLCLGAGLLMGLLMVAKVVFELSHDRFYPAAERIYVVRSNTADGQQFLQTAGATATGFQAEVAGVEAAARMVDRGSAWIETDDGQRWSGRHVLADSRLFDVLPRGDASSEALAVPGNMLVSRSLAAKIGDATTVRMGDKEYTVGGVFDDVPVATSLPRYDIVTSLEQTEIAQSWHSANRTFTSVVRLAPGVDPASLAPAIRRMQELHQADLPELRYDLFPLRDVHRSSPDTRRAVLILTILAAVVLAASVMNYALVDIAAAAERAMGIATRRCYGAQKSDIVRMVSREALRDVALSLAVATVGAVLLRGFIERSLQVPLGSLVGSPATGGILAAICAAVLAVAVIVPARMLSGVPVAAVFRNFKRSRRAWKLAMLAGQFAVSTFVVTFLLTVERQYAAMERADLGYDYRELVRIPVGRLSASERIGLVDRLERMPQVSGVALTDGLPYNMSGLGGNSVAIPGADEEIIIFDFGSASVSYPSVMGLRMVEGAGFTSQSADGSAVVSRSLADRIRALTGWESVVGRTVEVPIHGQSEIVGVYDGLLVGTMNEMDDRPSAMFLFTDPANPGFGVRDAIVRLAAFTGDNLAAVRAAAPEAVLMRDDLHTKYDATRMFRNSVLAVGLVIVAIVAAGLVGFVVGEARRRAAEVAIRKIHGARVGTILRLLTAGVGRVAVVAIVPGAVGAWFAAGRWMQNFAGRAPLSPVLFLAGSTAVLAVVVGCTLLSAARIARRNPVESLKSE